MAREGTVQERGAKEKLETKETFQNKVAAVIQLTYTYCIFDILKA